MRTSRRIIMDKSVPNSKPSDTAVADAVAVAHNVPTEVDNLVQTHATLGDKVANNSSEILELLLPFIPADFDVTKPASWKPTDYALAIKGLFSNLLKDKAFAQRLKQAHWKAYDLKNEAKPNFKLEMLTKDGKGTLLPTKAGQTVDLKLDAQTVMKYTPSEMTAMKSKGAKDPKSAVYQMYGASTYEWCKPVRDDVNLYSGGKSRDLRTSLVKALKKLLGVASNVASEPVIITQRIPNSLASIVKMRNKSTDNGHKWSAESTKLFNQGVELIEKSCK